MVFCASDYKMDWCPFQSQGNGFLTFLSLDSTTDSCQYYFLYCNSKCESVSSTLAVEYRVPNVVQLCTVGTYLAVPSPVFRFEHSSPH